jgi:hypothetical protein
METNICNFCNKSFKNRSNLRNHQQTAKYCLKIQKENENISIVENFKECEYCQKSFASNVIKRHIENCKNKKEKYIFDNEKIKELEIENQELKEKVNKLNDELNELRGELKVYKKDHDYLIDIARQPKSSITNNNKILNISSCIDFTDINKIRDIIDNNFNIEYILDGQKGFAKFALDNLLRDDDGNLKYMCTDPSRNIFKYKDNLGDIQKDVEAKKLTNYLVDGGIKKKALDLTASWFTDDNGDIDLEKFKLALEKQESLMRIKEDNNIFKKELIALTTI